MNEINNSVLINIIYEIFLCSFTAHAHIYCIFCIKIDDIVDVLLSNKVSDKSCESNFCYKDDGKWLIKF